LASDQTAPLRLRQRGFNTLAASADFSGLSLSAFLKERSGGYATGMAAIAGGFVLSALIILAGGRAMAPRLVAVELRSSALGSRQPTHHRIWSHSRVVAICRGIRPARLGDQLNEVRSRFTVHGRARTLGVERGLRLQRGRTGQAEPSFCRRTRQSQAPEPVPSRSRRSEPAPISWREH
jgi:hypothetical protein